MAIDESDYGQFIAQPTRKMTEVFYVSLLKISNPYFARVTQFTGAANSITDDQLHLLHSLVTSDHLVASFSVECDAVFRDSQTN